MCVCTWVRKGGRKGGTDGGSEQKAKFCVCEIGTRIGPCRVEASDETEGGVRGSR